ncbi:hypothetical protein Sjap_021897 [Stephania japonica]|uniref:Fatty acid desaturase domain-containing protein n=1 Tax=Stephania japonica TaxID=461633 RepID=A0AAP0EMW0_9MAGN
MHELAHSSMASTIISPNLSPPPSKPNSSEDHDRGQAGENEEYSKIAFLDAGVKQKNKAYWLREWRLWDLISIGVMVHIHVMSFVLVAILAFGEGWHNNHHAFEFSARHGHEWWQFDPGWYAIKVLEHAGLATHVKFPSEAQKIKRMALNKKV